MKTPLLHLDERLGHVAIDMGLMTREQVAETQARLLSENVRLTGASTFGKEALALGYLDPAKLEAVELEEHRRRRLITGYEIIDIIGTGTIATAYHAIQLAMDRDVALKILHPRLASDPVFVRNYIAEAQAVSRFHHPNIVQGFDAGECNGFYYFAHEYMSGGSMADRLRNGGPDATFSEGRLLSYLRQTTSGLRHAWAVAVYHGDINPGNLLLDNQGAIKIANLGVPRVAGLRGNSRQGIPGFVRCGPDYAAPEQLEKPELVDARTDIYNLGATFYHISFGVPPFVAPEGEDLAEYRRKNPMPAFSLESQEGYSGKYLRLIREMLELDPDKRPADPEELADRLEKFHLAPQDDIGGLARQVRQIAGPSASARSSQRLTVNPPPPSSHGNERTFSLNRRGSVAELSPGIRWLAIAIAAFTAALLTGFFLIN